MKDKKLLLGILVSFIVGALISYVITNKTVTRFTALNATCSVLNIAVDNKMITPEQVLELGQLTKKKLGEGNTADVFQLNDEQIKSASPHSNCSQFMVGMSSS